MSQSTPGGVSSGVFWYQMPKYRQMALTVSARPVSSDQLVGAFTSLR